MNGFGWEIFTKISSFNAGKTQLVWFDCSNNTGAIDVKIYEFVSRKNNLFADFLKLLGLTFTFKLNWGSYIISIAKTASKKSAALICSWKFLSPEVFLYLHKYTIQPCMVYCCHV